MDSGYTTEIAKGQTVSIPAGTMDTGYEIDGTVLDAGTLSNSEVGNSQSSGGATPMPPGPIAPTQPPTGTLEVQAGGEANNITNRPGSLLLVDTGGELDGFGDPTEFIGNAGAPYYTGDQLDVKAGGSADNGSVAEGFVNIAGKASDLSLNGDVTTISGSLDVFTFSGGNAGGPAFGNSITVENGGLLDEGTLDGTQDLHFQSGSAGLHINFESGIVTQDAQSTITDLTVFGSVANLDGYVGTLSVFNGGAAYLGGGAAGVTVNTPDPDFDNLIGLGENPYTISNEGVLLPTDFTGFDIENGGNALGVTDESLMSVQAGGMATDVNVYDLLAIFQGGKVTDAYLAGSAQVLLAGTMVYDRPGTIIDGGSIQSGTVTGPDPVTGKTVTLTFVGGQIVQEGTGDLVLSGDNSFSGGVSIDSGTVELASKTAAGTGGITFVEPNGPAHPETLKLDESAGVTVQGTTTFASPVSGLGSSTVIDLTGQKFQVGDTGAVSADGSQLELVGAQGLVQDTIALGSGAASGLTFLAVADSAGTGTAIVASPKLLNAAERHFAFDLSSGSTSAVLEKALREVASSGMASQASAFGFGAAYMSGRVAAFAGLPLQATSSTDIAALRDALTGPAVQAMVAHS